MAGQEDASGNRFALPTTKTAGVRIGVSYADQYMSMVSFGTDCPLGTETMVSMEMSRIERLKKPYGECVDSVPATNNFYSGFNYTLINCLRSCIQQRIIDNCGCGDPRYARPKGINECTVDKLGCIRRFKKANAQTEGSGNFSSINDCGCKPSCQESMINVATSFAKFPSDSYRVLSGPEASQDYACGNADSVFGSDTQRCIKWYQQNSAVLNVWYDGLDYEKNTEEVSYSVSYSNVGLNDNCVPLQIGDVANDLGGQTGLWLGISIISIVETIFLLIVSCAYCICGRKQKIAPLEHEVHRDPRAERIRQLRDELDEHQRKAEQLRRELLDQAVREEQQRIAQAAYERAVRAEAEAENAAAATQQQQPQQSAVPR
ncbi:Protein ASIC-2 [Aphelenchoides avenae]|nr:Protein ASIC-2 [Aphelenchus avenae]